MPWRPVEPAESDESRVVVPAVICLELATLLTGAELQGFFLLVANMLPSRPISRAPYLPWTDGRSLAAFAAVSDSPSLRVMRNMVIKATKAGILYGCRFGRATYYTIFRPPNGGP